MDTAAAYRWLVGLLLAGAVVGSPSRAWGVIIAGGDGTGNVTAPLDDPGWANVGQFNQGSAVYLGDNWVLTAHHVFGVGGVVNFGGTNFAVVSGSYQRLQVPGSPGSYADLGMFRIAGTPAGVAPLAIRSTSPAVGTPVVGVGYGAHRAATPTTWYVSTTGTWQWSESPGGGYDQTFTGYKYGAGSTKRWGTNDVQSTGIVADYGFGSTTLFNADFDSSGPASEMQLANGDSGGALFVKNGGLWELSGILAAKGTYDNQPANTAIFGNESYAIDLSYYRSQILAAVPEPGTWAMLAGLAAAGAVIAGRRRWRRDRSAGLGTP